MASLEGPLTIGSLAVGCALGYLDFRYAAEPWRPAVPKLAAWFAKAAEAPPLARTVAGGVNLRDPGLDPAAVIAALGLRPHPEGGHYREVWRDPRPAAGAAPAPRSTTCWLPASAATGTGWMPPKPGIGMPAGRWR